MIGQRPYLIHTNRELGMMLRGEKPLAVFADGEGAFLEVVVRYLRLFNRHVASGKIIRRDHFASPDHARKFTLHTILFALPHEAWRIEEMIELRASSQWSAEHERREGELLGYSDAENDWHIHAMYDA